MHRGMFIRWEDDGKRHGFPNQLNFKLDMFVWPSGHKLTDSSVLSCRLLQQECNACVMLPVAQTSPLHRFYYAWGIGQHRAQGTQSSSDAQAEGMPGDTWTNRQSEQPTDIRTGRQADRRTSREAGRSALTDIHAAGADEQRDRGRESHRQAGRQAGR